MNGEIELVTHERPDLTGDGRRCGGVTAERTNLASNNEYGNERYGVTPARLSAMPGRLVATLLSTALLTACGGATQSAAGPDDATSSTRAEPHGSTDPFTSGGPVTGSAASDAPAVVPVDSAASEPVALDPVEVPAGSDVAAETVTSDLPGCPDSERGAVADKDNQRYWLCANGVAVTDEIPMTTASENYGLPPVGTYPVFDRDENAYGIHGEALNRFVAFYTTAKGNRIAFHEVVNQDPATVGDLDQRGASAGCFRIREADSIAVWEFLQVDDPVVVIS
jgi:L,D-transpeptidase catalytic domain